jgi:hypothetical protein
MAEIVTGGPWPAVSPLRAGWYPQRDSRRAILTTSLWPPPCKICIALISRKGRKSRRSCVA